MNVENFCYNISSKIQNTRPKLCARLTVAVKVVCRQCWKKTIRRPFGPWERQALAESPSLRCTATLPKLKVLPSHHPWHGRTTSLLNRAHATRREYVLYYTVSTNRTHRGEKHLTDNDCVTAQWVHTNRIQRGVNEESCRRGKEQSCVRL